MFLWNAVDTQFIVNTKRFLKQNKQTKNEQKMEQEVYYLGSKDVFLLGPYFREWHNNRI